MRKYKADETEEFQRQVIDLAQEIRFNMDDKEELLNIANTLEEIAYNDIIVFSTDTGKSIKPSNQSNFPNGF